MLRRKSYLLLAILLGTLLLVSIAPSAVRSPVSLNAAEPVFIGSEPGKLPLSDDGHTLYTSLDGAGAVRRYDIASMYSFNPTTLEDRLLNL